MGARTAGVSPRKTLVLPADNGADAPCGLTSAVLRIPQAKSVTAGRSGFYRDLHICVRPAALESTAAFARIVVGGELQKIFAGLAECGCGGGFAGEDGAV